MPLIDMTRFEEAFPVLFRPGNRVSLGAGAGWEALLTDLCAALEALAVQQRAQGEPALRVVQIKEKCGSLRFYIADGCDEAARLIRDAERRSATTCEWCGSPDAWIQSPTSRMQALCGVHARQMQDDQNAFWNRARPLAPPLIDMTPFKAAFPLIFCGESWVSLSAGLGWRSILWKLCEDLEGLAREAWPDGAVPFQIAQIKEKMGVLMVYVYPRTDAVNALVQDALDRSASTCEWCGAPGARIRSIGGWMKATCEAHFNQRLAAPHVRWQDEPDEAWDQPEEGR